MPLTLPEVKNAAPKEKDYKLSDEKGLYLLVKKNGAKYWRLKYRFERKEKTLALGVFPEVTLTVARKRRDDARTKLQDGIDPSELKQQRKRLSIEAAENSFYAIAQEWLVKRGKKSESGDAKLVRLLERDIFPYLGKVAISTITPPKLLSVLRRIEDRGAVETAHRAKQYAGQIFRYAVAIGKVERDISADLKGALATPKSGHFAAIVEPREVGRLMVAIDNYQGTPVVMAALKLSPLLFCRQGELRHLEWTEIDWEEKRIELPAEKMKAKEPHVIPLSTQALTILDDLAQAGQRGKYVFPSARGASRPLSDNGVRTALRSLGYDNKTMTPHGFRAMARTLLDEQLGYRIEWIEQQLAHAVKDVHGRAYNRTKHLPQRTEMMQRYADYLDTLKASALAGNVVAGNFGTDGA